MSCLTLGASVSLPCWMAPTIAHGGAQSRRRCLADYFSSLRPSSVRLAGEAAAAARARAGRLAAMLVVAARRDGEQPHASLGRIEGAAPACLIDQRLRRFAQVGPFVGDSHAGALLRSSRRGGARVVEKRLTRRGGWSAGALHRSLLGRRSRRARGPPSALPSRAFRRPGRAFYPASRRISAKPVAGVVVAPGRVPGAARAPCLRGR